MSGLYCLSQQRQNTAYQAILLLHPNAYTMDQQAFKANSSIPLPTTSGSSFTMLSFGKGISKSSAADKKKEIIDALLKTGSDELQATNNLCRCKPLLFYYFTAAALKEKDDHAQRWKPARRPSIPCPPSAVQCNSYTCLRRFLEPIELNGKHWPLRKGEYYLYHPSPTCFNAPDFVPIREDHASHYTFTKWSNNLVELSQATWEQARAGSILYELNSEPDEMWPRGYYKCTIIGK